MSDLKDVVAAMKNAPVRRISYMKKAGLYRVRIDEIRELPHPLPSASADGRG